MPNPMYNADKTNAVRLHFTLGHLEDGIFDAISMRQIEIMLPPFFTTKDLEDHLELLLSNVIQQTYQEAYPHGNP
jgi:hypothetical protein